MKLTEFDPIRLNEAYISDWGDIKKPAKIRAFIIESMLEWYDDNGTDWSYGLIPEMLANYMEAINANGNESPEMAKIIKAAVKMIVDQVTEVEDEGQLEERSDELNRGIERLKRLNVYPDLLTALQKSMAATLKAEMDKWVRDNPDVEESVSGQQKVSITDPALVYDTDTEIDKKQLYSLVNKYKTMLPLKMAKILDMKSQGYTSQMIADELGLSQSLVNNQYQIGLNKLQRALVSNAPDDIKRFYGYKGEIPKSKYQPYTVNIRGLWNQVKNDPSLKIVKVGANAFLTVPVDDPRPEVIYEPLGDDQAAALKDRLLTLKAGINQLETTAAKKDRQQQSRRKYNQTLLKNDPRYQQLLARINQIQHRLSKTWYVKSDNDL